jgi:acylphosphatase
VALLICAADFPGDFSYRIMNGDELTSVRVTVYGRVQGVFFRAFTLQQATNLNLNGYVANLPGGESIRVEAEGARRQLVKLIECLRKGPPRARVDRLETEWLEYRGSYDSFDVR